MIVQVHIHIYWLAVAPPLFINHECSSAWFQWYLPYFTTRPFAPHLRPADCNTGAKDQSKLANSRAWRPIEKTTPSIKKVFFFLASGCISIILLVTRFPPGFPKKTQAAPEKSLASLWPCWPTPLPFASRLPSRTFDGALPPLDLWIGPKLQWHKRPEFHAETTAEV